MIRRRHATKSPIERERQRVWSKWSKEVLSDHDTECEFCGHKKWRFFPRLKIWKSTRTFVLHHITYEHVGHETREDVQILCASCHNILHTLLRKIPNTEAVKEIQEVVKKYFIYEPGAYSESRRRLKEDDRERT